MPRSIPYIRLVILLGVVSGFMAYEHISGKLSPLGKAAAVNEVLQTTGVATVGYDTTYGADFIRHRLEGQLFPNTLYQGFLAVHFDEMDTVFHSAVGRTNGKSSPGDVNSFTAPSPGFLIVDSSGITQRYSADTLANFHVRQTVLAVNDSGTVIYLSFILEFINPPGGNAIYSNFKLLFGYDGDIGSTLGGYMDDSTGLYTDDSAAVVYVFDHDLSLYGGVGLASMGLNATGGNFARLHQTVNDSGRTEHDLDTLLLGFMNHPGFSSAAQNTDGSVYWAIDLGTIQPADTIRDTVRFVLVNGVTQSDLIQSARGHKVVAQHSTGPAEGSALPSSIHLYSNYPNPFNPSTTFRYTLDREAAVSLTVYNVLGQEIRKLVAARQPAGDYTTVWDGKNSHGQPAAAGIYFYRLRADGTVQTRKMLLIK